MSITELSIKRPILIIVVFLILGLAGLFSYTQLRYELLPDIDAPFVTISTIYPGAAPSEVEAGVTKKIEDAVAAVDGLKRITSNSSENLSVVILEFRQGTSHDQATQNVQRKINEMLDLLPTGAKTPSVVQYKVSDIPIVQVGITANIAPRELSELLRDNIQQRLARISGVGNVLLIGNEEREIRIRMDAEKLSARGIPPALVAQALQRENINIPAGVVKSEDMELSVQVAGKADVAEKLAGISVLRYPDGSFIRLGDIATITDDKKDMLTAAMLNSKTSITMKVFKQSDANAVEMSERCRAELAALEKEFADIGLRCEIAQDASEFTLAAAEDVNKDIFIAIGLVALVMFIFLHSLRNSLIVMVAIPASLLSTMLFMNLFGFTLNLMTLLAMSLVIGILVDDSIVVLENIYHHLEKGKEKVVAALDGRNEIGFAALAVTLVDVVVFVPLSLTPGLIGSIVRQFSLVIVISTLFSLLVSFTLTPMLASRFGKIEQLSKHSLMGRFGLWFERIFAVMTDAYEVLLHKALQHKITVFFISAALFIGSLMLPGMGLIGGEFVPMTDKGEITATIELAGGTPIEETSRFAREFEQKLRAMPEVKRVITGVGVSSAGMGESVSNTIEYSLSFVPKEQRTKSIQDLGNEVKLMAYAIPGVKARVMPIGIFGGGEADPIQITVSGAQREQVRIFADSLAAVMRGISGTADVRTSGETQKREVAIHLDTDKAARLGVATEDIGMTMRIAYAGYDELSIQQGTKQIPIRLQLLEHQRRNINDIQQLAIPLPDATNVPVGSIADIHTTFSYSTLERKDRANAVSIFSKAVNRPSGDIGEDIKKALKNMTVPEGISVTLGGDLELQDDSFNKLGLAFIAALILVYFVMVMLYNSWIYPFVVLFSIPVAVVGAFAALAIAGKTINIFSIFGLIMMIGLVAKNGILLVDRTNENRHNGNDIRSAIIEAGRARLRPILMTTLAMVIGMLPIALAGNAGGELKSGLGWVLVGGLSSSMILTLVLVPAVYESLASVRERFMQWRAKRGSSATATIAANTATGVMGWIVAGMFIASSITVQAQIPSTPLSLTEAIRRAKQENPDIRIAQLEQDAAAERIRQVNGMFLPTVALEAQYTRNLRQPVFFLPSFGFDAGGNFIIDENNVQPVVAALRNNLSFSANLSMPLFNKELSEQQSLSETSALLTEEQRKAITETVVYETAKLYITILNLQEQKTLITQNIQRAKETLAEAKSLFSKGLATDSDTLRAFVAVQTSTPQLRTIEVATESYKRQLALLIGARADEIVVLTDSLAALPLPENALVELQPNNANTFLAKRSDFKQILINEELVKLQRNAENSRYLPSVALFANYTGQGQSNTFSFSQFPTSSALGLQFSWTIFDGFTREARIQEQEIRLQQTAIRREATARAITAEAISAQEKLAETQIRVDSERGTVAAAERSYKAVQSRYKQGFSRQLDLADANLQLVQAKVQYVQALYELHLAALDVQKAQGLLTKD